MPEFALLAQRHTMAIIAIVLVAVPFAAGCVMTWSARVPRASAAMVGLAALATVVAGASVFIAIAMCIAHGTAFSSADQRLLDAVRDGTPVWAARGFALFTHLGDPWFFTLLCVLMCAALLFARRFGLAVYSRRSRARAGCSTRRSRR